MPPVESTVLNVELKVRRGLVLRLVADRARSFALVLGVGFLLLVSRCSLRCASRSLDCTSATR